MSEILNKLREEELRLIDGIRTMQITSSDYEVQLHRLQIVSGLVSSEQWFLDNMAEKEERARREEIIGMLNTAAEPEMRIPDMEEESEEKQADKPKRVKKTSKVKTELDLVPDQDAELEKNAEPVREEAENDNPEPDAEDKSEPEPEEEPEQKKYEFAEVKEAAAIASAKGARKEIKALISKYAPDKTDKDGNPMPKKISAIDEKDYPEFMEEVNALIEKYEEEI